MPKTKIVDIIEVYEITCDCGKIYRKQGGSVFEVENDFIGGGRVAEVIYTAFGDEIDEVEFVHKCSCGEVIARERAKQTDIDRLTLKARDGDEDAIRELIRKLAEDVTADNPE